jgi:hypothetical protein
VAAGADGGVFTPEKPVTTALPGTRIPLPLCAVAAPVAPSRRAIPNTDASAAARALARRPQHEAAGSPQPGGEGDFNDIANLRGKGRIDRSVVLSGGVALMFKIAVAAKRGQTPYASSAINKTCATVRASALQIQGYFDRNTPLRETFYSLSFALSRTLFATDACCR